jgi:integrase
MICYVFKPRRKATGTVNVSAVWFGALRMGWEQREKRWSLGTADKREAERLLHAARVKAEMRHYGRLPPESQTDAAEKPLVGLLSDFLGDLRVLGRAEGTLQKYGHMRVMFERCGWQRIGDVTPRSFCDWRARSDLAPRTLNSLLKDTGTFFRWLRRQKMAAENPLEFVQCVETRRLEKYRRALTEDEVRRLIAAAPHKRAVVYLLAVYTGLRRAELGQLTVGDFIFDSPAPFVRVRSGTAKHPKVSNLRLRPELVDAIRSILPENAKPVEIVFSSVPRVRTFQKDLAAAGINFEDESGRRVDFHALRDTFGTHLAASGVAPFVLKELMRHSTVQQSEKYYIDATHLPLAAAIAALPMFSPGRLQTDAIMRLS